jgi:putative aminopeptidase FrvX
LAGVLRELEIAEELRDTAVSTLVQLLEVYTPPGEERRIERTWMRVCASLGYRRAWRDEVGNYFASAEAAAGQLCWSATSTRCRAS